MAQIRVVAEKMRVMIESIGQANGMCGMNNKKEGGGEN